MEFRLDFQHFCEGMRTHRMAGNQLQVQLSSLFFPSGNLVVAAILGCKTFRFHCKLPTIVDGFAVLSCSASGL